jgi:DNA-binding response OmpR family regulator
MQPNANTAMTQLRSILAAVDEWLAKVSVGDVENLHRFSSMIPVIVLVPKSRLTGRVAYRKTRAKRTKDKIVVGKVIGLANRDVRKPKALRTDFDVEFSDVTVSYTAMEVRRRGVPVALTSLEFKTLKYMAMNEGKVLSRDELLNEVWGYENYPCTRTVDNHIFNLRQKLEPDPRNPVYFETVFSVGYRFRLQPPQISMAREGFSSRESRAHAEAPKLKLVPPKPKPTTIPPGIDNAAQPKVRQVSGIGRLDVKTRLLLSK